MVHASKIATLHHFFKKAPLMLASSTFSKAMLPSVFE
jgi:hypothetical protein